MRNAATNERLSGYCFDDNENSSSSDEQPAKGKFLEIELARVLLYILYNKMRQNSSIVALRNQTNRSIVRAKADDEKQGTTKRT